MSIVCIIGNRIPFTEFKYLHAIKHYGNLNFQKIVIIHFVTTAQPARK